jgi:outer membrane lipoprotein-sorting protein
MDKQETAGVLSFKAPAWLRMDYTNPKERVIVFNGELLSVY